MARVALVTGETRGIGKAISLALKALGYLIVANYTENDEAAEKFKVVNGICKRGFRRVVNISSINEQKGQCGQTNYVTVKAGVMGAMVLEIAFKGITINTEVPSGYVGTGMVRAVPEDARFITGGTLTASGGQYLA
jgi:NAD(P)-dependent dehydrogenase (short-subunit alcohol dehydrogenase family)